MDNFSLSFIFDQDTTLFVAFEISCFIINIGWSEHGCCNRRYFFKLCSNIQGWINYTRLVCHIFFTTRLLLFCMVYIFIPFWIILFGHYMLWIIHKTEAILRPREVILNLTLTLNNICLSTIKCCLFVKFGLEKSIRCLDLPKFGS